MLKIISFVLVIFFCTGSTTSLAEDNFTRVLNNAGVKVGMPYSKVKSLLRQTGWSPKFTNMEDSPPYKHFPEISCGSGYDAICTVEFVKANESESIIVQESKKGIIFLGTY